MVVVVCCVCSLFCGWLFCLLVMSVVLGCVELVGMDGIGVHGFVLRIWIVNKLGAVHFGNLESNGKQNAGLG